MKTKIKNRIAQKLILYTIVFSSLITLIITAFQLLDEYRYDVRGINQKLEQIKISYTESIAQSVWLSDRSQLQLILDGITEQPDIVYSEVDIEHGESIKSGTIPEVRSIRFNADLHRTYNDEPIYIGKFIVSASLADVYSRLWKRLWVILLSNALKTFLVAIFIYFIFSRLVEQHLSRIADFVSKDDFGTLQTPLSLNRNNKGMDELDVVVSSINELRHGLHQHIDELNRQKQHLSQTLHSIGDAVIVTDIEGNVTRMNPVAEQLTGWTLAETKGKSLKSIFPIVDASTRKTIENPVDKVISTGETVYLSNHTTLISKSGKEYQIADSAAAIRNGEQVLGMVLVFNDVTEQYRLRQTAAKNRRDLQAFMDNTPAVIYVKDIDGRFTFLNQRFTELFHMPAETVIGKTAYDIFPQELADEMRRNDEDVIKAGHALESEEVAMHGGELRDYLSIKFPLFDEDGKAYAICGISTDITERKHSEETAHEAARRLKDAQRMAHFGNWDLDLVDNRLSWSDETYRIFGADPEQSDDPYEIFSSRLSADDLKKTNALFDAAVANKTPYSTEHHLLMDDGNIKHVHERCEIFYDAEGKPLRAAGTVQDVTERVTMEEALRRTLKMDALGKLTGGIAHDYNNMLGVILGYTSMLEDELGEQPALREYVTKIRRAGERGAQLTKKLLSFSRHKISRAENLDINILLQEEQQLLEKTLTARIKMVLNLTNDPWPISVDAGDLEDALVNMCINAMHAIEGNGQLTIETRNLQLSASNAQLLNLPEGDYVTLQISDTGCGMDETTRSRIFDPFYTTKGERGTGLGLSQVYGFMDRSSGSIEVHSKSGEGSHFVLYFPRSEKMPDTSEPTSKASPHNLQGSETLLIVDDEPAIAELARDILSAHGYRILMANDGEQALATLEKAAQEKQPIALMISDIIMPNINGYKLATEVQRRYPHIKLQMVSGFADERLRKEEDETLRLNLLHKPYTADALLLRVRSLLDSDDNINDTTHRPRIDGRRILVMDDDENMQTLFKINLEKLGCIVTLAEHGTQAIDLYQQSMKDGKTMDIVILDLTVPGTLNGVEVAEKICAMDPRARLIVASGHSEGPEMTRFNEFGFHGALEKTFNREKMRQVLESVLNQNQ